MPVRFKRSGGRPGVSQVFPPVAEKATVEKALVVSRHAVLVAGFRSLIAERRGIELVECTDLAYFPAARAEVRPGVVLVDATLLPDPGWLREWKLRVPH